MSPSLWVTLEKFAQQAIWLALFAVLAPILGPKPYGLFAIVMVFVGFCEFVTVEAAAEALMGMDPLEDMHIRTATTLNVAMSLAAGAAVFLLAPLFGRVFDAPELAPLFRALSILPAISALTSAPTAVLKRRLEFRPLALRSTLGLTIGGAVGVGLAIAGAGAWALVAQILLQRTAEVIILWSCAGRAAGFGWSRRHYLDLRIYAAHVFVSRGMTFLGGQVPRLIIGYFLGPVDLGLFTLASRLPDTLALVVISPRAIVARIALKKYRAGEPALQTAFHRLLRDIALIGFPMALGAAAVIPLLYSVWLDDRWQGGAVAAQLMLLTVPPLVMFYGASAVLLALNFPREEARTSIAQSVSYGLFTLAAVPFGLNAVCAAAVLRMFLLMPYPAALVARVCGLSKRSMLDALALPFAMSVAMGLVVLLLDPMLETRLPHPMAFATLVLAGCVVYVGMVVLLARDEIKLFLSRLPQLP